MKNAEKLVIKSIKSYCPETSMWNFVESLEGYHLTHSVVSTSTFHSFREPMLVIPTHFATSPQSIRIQDLFSSLVV